ncbi:MAG: rRNA pseudouridine synthase [Bdellovibrionaceae bacterium]|nr:rRNA pseudouridine synthase [Pseudobdellovibrionaceae bacterium]
MSEKPLIRLSKLMADRGLASRREADELISQGLVYVNGVICNQLGAKFAEDVSITLAAEALRKQKKLVTIMLNKPKGYVSAQPEKGYTPAIRLLRPENQWIKDPQKLGRGDLRELAVVGRLDIDSQGLLLFTQDGRVARKIIGPNSNVEKEYLVRFEGPLSDQSLALLRFGLELDGVPLKPAKVDQINENQLKFILTEGRKRQIRRMCELVGLKVTGLKRVRIGELRLGDLPEGQWCFISPERIFKGERNSRRSSSR